MTRGHWFGAGAALLIAVGMTTVPSGAGAAAALEAEVGVEEACIMTYEGDTTCYASPDALLAAVTGEAGRGLTNADLGDADVVEQVEAGLQAKAGSYSRAAAPTADAAAVANNVNAIFFDGTSYGGASLYMISPYRCDNDTGVEVTWTSLTPAWQNRIGSGQGYNYCDFKLWDYTYFGGAAFGFVSASINLGAMNNQTESVKMR